MRIALLALLFAGSVHAADLSYKVATWNVLCDYCVHAEGFAPWDDRKADIITTVLAQSPDIIGFQEVAHSAQLSYITTEMIGYSACVGPPAGALRNPVFVKNGLDYECFAGFFVFETTRVCTHLAVAGVNYYNCHFPLGEAENLTATQALLSQVQAPFVFLGDFNTHRERYPQSHALLTQYPQTQEPPDPSVFFYYILDIDRIGTSEDKQVSFTRLETGFMSDHRYLEAWFKTAVKPGTRTALQYYFLSD